MMAAASPVSAKLAPGFFASEPVVRTEQSPSLSLGTHQENTTYLFVFVSGCVVAPNSAGPIFTLPTLNVSAPAPQTTYTGTINYQYAAFVLSFGTFSGQITSPSGQTYNISGYINGVGLQAGIFSGSAPVSFTASSPQNIGSSGVIFTGSVGLNDGPIDIASVGDTLSVSNSGNVTPGEPEGSVLGVSTETNPASPGEIARMETSIGVSIGVQGVTVTKVTLVPQQVTPGG